MKGVVPYINSYSRIPKDHQSTMLSWPAAKEGHGGIRACWEGAQAYEGQSEWQAACKGQQHRPHKALVRLS